MFRGFCRRSPLWSKCQCGRLRMAVELVVCVMRRLTTVVAMVERCRVDSIHALTKYSAVAGAQLCQYSSCLPWQCLFSYSNGRRSAIKLHPHCNCNLGWVSKIYAHVAGIETILKRSDPQTFLDVGTLSFCLNFATYPSWAINIS